MRAFPAIGSGSCSTCGGERNYDLLHRQTAPVRADDRYVIEIYSAAQNDLRALAAMGLRAPIEHIMIEKIGDIGSFETKINAFTAAVYVPAVGK